MLYLIGFIVLDVLAALLGVVAITHSGRTKRAYLDSFISMVLGMAALLLRFYGSFAKSVLPDFQEVLVLAIATAVVVVINLIALIVSAIRRGFRLPEDPDAPPPPPEDEEIPE